MQSGYAELLGFYPPGEEQQTLTVGEQKSLSSGKGMPPMRIKSAKAINDFLGNKAIIDGYTQIPIYTYSQPTTDDDLNYGGC